MVMPERLPPALPSSPEISASPASAARVVMAPMVASVEFTAVPKRRSFTAKDQLQILAETDRAADTGGISAILRREGPLFPGLERRAGREAGTPGARQPRPRGPEKGCGEAFASRTGQGQSGECHLASPPAPPSGSGGSDHRPPKNRQRCWTRWGRRPAAAAHHEDRRCGIDAGQRPDDGASAQPWKCRGPLCTGIAQR